MSHATMLSIREVAIRWTVSAKTIYGLVERGELRAVKVGRLLRIPIAVIESYEQASAAPGGN
jgi:excisionase family DNA binding protein